MRRLTAKNGAAVLVDDDVAEQLRDRSLRVDSRGYPYLRENGRRVGLHRWIVGAPPGQMVDHRDGNPLNNRRSNLRLTDNGGNQANRRAVRTRTHIKGVTVHRSGRFQAQVKREGVNRYLGLFDCPVKAGYAYARAAKKLSGEFAYSNVHSRQARRRAREFAEQLRRDRLHSNDSGSEAA